MATITGTPRDDAGRPLLVGGAYTATFTSNIPERVGITVNGDTRVGIDIPLSVDAGGTYTLTGLPDSYPDLQGKVTVRQGHNGPVVYDSTWFDITTGTIDVDSVVKAASPVAIDTSAELIAEMEAIRDQTVAATGVPGAMALTDADPASTFRQQTDARYTQRDRAPLNVRDYVTDLNLSPVTIAAQVNQALSDAAAQGRLLTGFGGLTLPVGAQINAPAAVRVDQQDGTLLRVGGVFDVVVGASGMRWHNLRVDGNGPADLLTKTNSAHRFCGVRLLGLTDVRMTGETYVTRTVSAEIQTEGNRSPIMVEGCSDAHIDFAHTRNNDGSGTFFHTTTMSRIVRLISDNDTGSGFTSSNSDDCRLGDAEARNSGQGSGLTYSGISLNGARWKAGMLVSTGCTGAGVNLGHTGDGADDAYVLGVYAEGNELEGLLLTNSVDVRVESVESVANAASATLSRNNIAVRDGSTRSHLANVRSRSSVKGSGIYYQSGTKHRLAVAELRDNAVSGFHAEANTSGRMNGVESYNNGRVTSGNSAGVLLNTAIGWRGDDVRAYDDQSTQTQESGLWVAGGSSHKFTGSDFTGNKTHTVRQTSSPTGLEFVDTKGTTATTVSVGGKALSKVDLIASTLTPTTSIPANSTAEQAFAVAGVAVGDHVSVTSDAMQTGLGITNARVSSAGNVAIRWTNNTAAAITPTSTTYRFQVIRSA